MAKNRRCLGVVVVTLLLATLLSAGGVYGDGTTLTTTAGIGAVDLSLGYGQATPEPAAVKEPPPPPPYDVWTTKRLTGDWGGLRTDLEDQGVSLSLILTTSYAQNFRGGLNTHNAVAFSGDWRMNLTLDFDKMGLIPGAWFFIRGKSSWNNGVDADVGNTGALHWVFGSGGDEEFYIDKWWYGQRLWEDLLEFRIGKLLTPADLFDIPTYAKWPWDHFMNAALNRSPIVPHRKSLGAFLKIKFGELAQFKIAGVDGDQKDSTLPADVERALHGPATYIGLSEFVLTPKFESAHGPLPGNYAVGLWYDGRTKQVFRDDLGGQLGPRSRSDDVGWYLVADQHLWMENEDPQDKQGLWAFMRYSFAHPEVNRINHFWSVGAEYKGLIPGRDKDVLAFGVAQSILSKTFRHNINGLADRETVYELYYAYHVTPWCIISPDLQFITNPGGLDDARDAIVGGIRVRMAF
jgi:porin